MQPAIDRLKFELLLIVLPCYLELSILCCEHSDLPLADLNGECESAVIALHSLTVCLNCLSSNQQCCFFASNKLLCK